jgi:hypothetical protein
MDRQLLSIACALAFAIVKARTAIARAWWIAMGDRADRYRPEAHYMRGPVRSGTRNTSPSAGRCPEVAAGSVAFRSCMVYDRTERFERRACS